MSNVPRNFEQRDCILFAVKNGDVGTRMKLEPQPLLFFVQGGKDRSMLYVSA